MKLATLPLTGRRMLMFGLAALVSCFMLYGTSDAVAKATATTSLTQAQKLSKALKACKKLPTKKKRVACVKRAKKKYGTHPAVTHPPATTPAAPVMTPPASVTPPTGSVAGPTLAWLQEQVERFQAGTRFTGLHIANVTILERGAPHLGSGVAQQYGGDGVLNTTMVYPLKWSFDQMYQIFRGTGQVPEWYEQTEHWFYKGYAQLPAGSTQ
ncbi:MAG TPA: hypothetical protein VNZ05_10270, partial [Solirubrobacteraceae bacterium]|nr:hypothetical protein [Solirubrobacteraceae bacterium]